MTKNFKTISDNLGWDLKKLRRAYRITQLDLAKAIEVSRATVISWEKNSTRPSRKHLDKIEAVFKNISSNVKFNVKSEVNDLRLKTERKYKSMEKLTLLEENNSLLKDKISMLEMKVDELQNENVMPSIQGTIDGIVQPDHWDYSVEGKVAFTGYGFTLEYTKVHGKKRIQEVLGYSKDKVDYIWGTGDPKIWGKDHRILECLTEGSKRHLVEIGKHLPFTLNGLRKLGVDHKIHTNAPLTFVREDGSHQHSHAYSEWDIKSNTNCSKVYFLNGKS